MTTTPHTTELVAFQVREGRSWRTIVQHLSTTAGRIRTNQTKRGRVEGKHYRFAKVQP